MEPKRNIDIATFDNLSQRNGNLFLPVLIDIKHSGIIWDESNRHQQNGHLRLVCNTQALRYKGDDDTAYLYEPCTFSFKPPKEDGKTKGSATITISCLDSRLIEIIRGITEGLTCKVVALYSKIKNENGTISYAFSKFYSKEFEMGSVTWDNISAQWTLEPDSTLNLSVPKDRGSLFRFPSIVEG